MEENKYPGELKDTVEQMLSDDWKERFRAEYNQLNIRIYKLGEFMKATLSSNNRWAMSREYELRWHQLKGMIEYRAALCDLAILLQVWSE